MFSKELLEKMDKNPKLKEFDSGLETFYLVLFGTLFCLFIFFSKKAVSEVVTEQPKDEPRLIEPARCPVMLTPKGKVLEIKVDCEADLHNGWLVIPPMCKHSFEVEGYPNTGDVLNRCTVLLKTKYEGKEAT